MNFSSISSSTKLHLETAAIIFVASFLTAAGAALTNITSASFSVNVLLPLITTALGVATRATYTSLVSSSIGAGLKR